MVIFSSDDDYSLVDDKLLEDRQRFVCGNANVWRLSDENLLLHACIHHFWHLRGTYSELKPLLDVVYILHRLGGHLDWNKFFNLIEIHDVIKAVSIPLYQAKMLYPTVLPESVAKEVCKLVSQDEKILSSVQFVSVNKNDINQIVDNNRLQCIPLKSSPILNPSDVLLSAVIKGSHNHRLSGDLLVHLSDGQAGNLLKVGKIPWGSFRFKDIEWKKTGLNNYELVIDSNKNQIEIVFRRKSIFIPDCIVKGQLSFNNDFIECVVSVNNRSPKVLNDVQYIFSLCFQDIFAEQKGAIYIQENKKITNLPYDQYEEQGFRQETFQEDKALGILLQNGHGYLLVGCNVRRIEQLLSGTKSAIQIGVGLGHIKQNDIKTTKVRLYVGKYSDSHEFRNFIRETVKNFR